MKTILRLFLVLLCSYLVASCAYLQQTFRQAGYQNQFARDHKRSIQKHLLTSETFFVYGKLVDEHDVSKDYPLAVAAMGDIDKGSELVDITHMVRANSFYGLHLPPGDYQLLALADVNSDGFYNNVEILASLPLHLDIQSYPYRVAGSLDIVFDASQPSAFPSPIDIQVQTPPTTRERHSLFYPKGTIRQLDAPIFSETNARLGMYSPADFMEQAPMMFYALEEERGYKVPVVFVHGVGGSVTNFSSIIERLDRQRYKPLFYYYPSGADLEKLAHLFYRIFLSGKMVELDERTPLIVVAHSMGGLVVRKAINFYQGTPEENKIDLFISIATPFGGHPDAKLGVEMAPMVLPSWYNMNPDGEFIRTLYEKPLPDFLEHHLFYAYGNPSTLKLGENSDGVVPLSSQLYHPAQAQSTRQYGYDRGHTGILSDQDMIAAMLGLIAEYRFDVPESHMKYLVKGGFDVQLPDSYTDLEKYAIHVLGHYIGAMANGRIQPIDHYGTHFLSVLKGEARPTLFTESAWLKFRSDFPELAAESP
jgi:pimeloyl-ACP methyl ester carboxylesterase